MNEKDIRDRIGQFLKKTARTVVVPASMGLGLSSTACNGNGLHHAGDAGLDAATAPADAAKSSPDQFDTAIKYDVPLMMVPYVVAMPPDAAAAEIPFPPPPYLAPFRHDAATDVSSDATADIFSPVPPYLAPMPFDAATDGAREAPRGDAEQDAQADVRADLPYPPPPYLILPMLPDDKK